jgi:dTMP kinase
MSIIAFEGIDACGKTTQIQSLHNHLGKDAKVSIFSFPDYTTRTGEAIARLLQDTERDPLVLQAMMSMNRYERQTEIAEALEEGFVIFDRYWLSGLVYGAADGLDRSWLREVHTRLIQPDRWIILDLPVAESFKRRPVRDDAYEANEARLEAARKLYQTQSDQRRTTIINAAQEEEFIFDDILEATGL